MNSILSGNGELPLLCDNSRVVAFDGLEQWQAEQLMNPTTKDSKPSANICLMSIDHIVKEWLEALTPDQWAKIKRQKSLYGIPMPEQWIKVWRVILKEPRLRDSRSAARNGQALGSYMHIWNIWSEECIDKYLDPMDKYLLALVDQGYLYSEIGEIMLKQYGDEFWKPRKAETKTTPGQVVNNYLYWKLPNKIARAELTDTVKHELLKK